VAYLFGHKLLSQLHVTHLEGCELLFQLILLFFHLFLRANLTMVLQWCNSGVAVVISWCYMLQCCCSGVAVVSKGFNSGGTILLL
jgi:hypothetical protein